MDVALSPQVERIEMQSMHICSKGRENNIIDFTYEMGPDNIQLESVKEEKDLGVTVTNTLQPSKHCAEAGKKAYHSLRSIRRSFHYLTEESFLILYKCYVRPHLEFSPQAWSPSLRKDIDLLEKVQQRATKFVPSLKNLDYHARLEKLKLTTLELRRKRGDMI